MGSDSIGSEEALGEMIAADHIPHITADNGFRIAFDPSGQDVYDFFGNLSKYVPPCFILNYNKWFKWQVIIFRNPNDGNIFYIMSIV